jgi:hypothetical protein
LKHGFGDEAGDVGWATGSSRHLVVAIVVTHDPQHLRRIVARIRQGLDKKLKQVPELKAHHTPEHVIARLLRKVAEQDVEIVAVVWRKASSASSTDPEEGYRQVCRLAVEHCLKRYPQLSLTLDKRYTDARLRDRLVEAITDGIGPQAVLVLQQVESRQEQALQVADAVAWSLFQKYERGDEMCYDILRSHIVIEDVVEKTKNWPSLGADSHRSTTE